MKKVISLFKRDYEDSHQVYNEVVPGAEWVIEGEGVATEKIDGTSCLVRNGKLYRRYDAKQGKTPLPNFEPTQEPDEVTGHWPGWIPVGDGPEDKWSREAFGIMGVLYDGTYELVGPKVQGNPYNLDRHELWKHGSNPLVYSDPRTFEEIREWLEVNVKEGIVWHHPDGRMVKIKRKDFGLKWPVKAGVGNERRF